MLGAKIAQDRNRQPVGERGRQRDFQHALGPALFLDHFAERLIDAIERFGDDRQNVASRLGQHQLLRPTLEQRDAEEILQHDDMPADRALRDRQTVGRRRETEMLTRRFESAQRVKRQPFAIHRPSPRTTREFLSDARPREPIQREIIAHAGFVGQHDIASAVDPQGLRHHVVAPVHVPFRGIVGKFEERRVT